MLLNVDALSELLRAGGSKAKVRGLVDSGWFLDNEPFTQSACLDPRHCSPAATLKKGIKLWRSAIPDRCHDANTKDSWNCFYGAKLYPHLASTFWSLRNTFLPLIKNHPKKRRNERINPCCFFLNFCSACVHLPVALRWSPTNGGKCVCSSDQSPGRVRSVSTGRHGDVPPKRLVRTQSNVENIKKINNKKINKKKKIIIIKKIKYIIKTNKKNNVKKKWIFYNKKILILLKNITLFYSVLIMMIYVRN